MTPLDLDGMLRRLHLPTVRRLYPELETRTEAEGLSHRDFLALLIAEEVGHRAQTRIVRSVRKARFPFLRTIEDFDFTFQTSVRLQLLGSYLGPERSRSPIAPSRMGTRPSSPAPRRSSRRSQSPPGAAISPRPSRATPTRPSL
jgi:IstB-like ATP binding protein